MIFESNCVFSPSHPSQAQDENTLFIYFSISKKMQFQENNGKEEEKVKS